jgi:hypothetical protein
MKLTADREEVARQIADEIRHQSTGLDNEDRQAAGIALSSYARAKKYRDQDRAKVNGMRIALTFVLGRPNDMQLADAFIADAPHWRGLP